MQKLVIITGAGISAESGIPTFRSSTDGLWQNHKIEEVALFSSWKRNYRLVHAFYNDRRVQIATALPNKAHFGLARIQQEYNTSLFTQNIDDLLEKAGAEDVIHLHGSIKEMLCTACGHVWNVEYEPWLEGSRCPRRRCSSHYGVKPNVVLFGEKAPKYPQFWKTIEALTPQDVLLVAGTSGTVIPVQEIVDEVSCTTILANLEPEESINPKSITQCFFGSLSTTIEDIQTYLGKILEKHKIP